MATTAVNVPHPRSSTASTASSVAAASAVARRGISSPPSLLNARLFARFSAGYAQEQKMAELRAAYASPAPATANTYSSAPSASASTTPNARRNAPTRSSLPFANPAGLPIGIGIFGIGGGTNSSSDLLAEAGESRKNGFHSNSSSRRGSAVANCLPTPSIMDLAASAGLLSLSPSDLVFESSVLGIAYYDFILSVSEVVSPNGSSASASSGSSSTVTIRGGAESPNSTQNQQNQLQMTPKKLCQLSPAGKRRVCNTGSEPTAQTNSAREHEKGPLMMVKSALANDKQRPGTSTGFVGTAEQRRKGSAMSNVSSNGSGQMPMAQQLLLQKASATSAPPEMANGAMDGETAPLKPSAKFANCNYRLFLAKLDSHTNVEWFESVLVPGDLLERNGIPVNELSLLTMGILVWRSRLANSRLLCLANGQLGEDSTTALEALKRAAGKYKCMHHVLTIGQRRQSASSTHSSCSTSSYRSSSSCGSHGQSQDAGMKLRVLMCQSRSELPEVPNQALRDAKFLMAPSSNPLLCLCFPLT